MMLNRRAFIKNILGMSVILAIPETLVNTVANSTPVSLGLGPYANTTYIMDAGLVYAPYIPLTLTTQDYTILHDNLTRINNKGV